MTRKEKILVRKALKELNKIYKAVGAIIEENGEDMGYTADQLHPIDQAQANARQALLELPGMKP